MKAVDLRLGRGILVNPEISKDPAAGRGLRLDELGRIPLGVLTTTLAVLTADPASPGIGQVWYRSDTSQLCIRHDASTTKRVTLA